MMTEVPDSTKSNFESDQMSMPEEAALWRILDAAANRTAEGLRVVEDYARLGLDDGHLTAQLKELRHALTAALSLLPMEMRLAGRETTGDVGTRITSAGEQSRADLESVVIAGWKRAQQGLRTLEEYGKLVSGDVAARCEALRYQSYTLERALDITRTSRELLAAARLYVLIDGGTSAESFAALAGQLVQAGVHVLQLRDKRLTDRELLARAKKLRELTQGTSTLLVMNDRADLARLCQADGVHVGQEELTVKEVRAIVGARMLIGVSTHNIEQARQAVLDGANYIGIGPTFPSTTKQFDTFPGLGFARSVASEISLPAFAIGGITLEKLGEVQAAGIHRVAVGAAVTAASDPGQAARELLKQLTD